MIVGKFTKAPILQNDDPGAAGGGLNIIETDDNGAPIADGGKGGATTDTDPDGTGIDDADRGDSLVIEEPTAAQLEQLAREEGGNRIPQARLNEVVAQRDAEREARKLADERAAAAEAELANLRAGKPSAAPAPAATAAPAQTPAAPAEPEFDERAAEERYAELLADGEFKQAAELRMQINEQIRTQAAIEVDQRRDQERITQSLNEVASQAVADFPYLDTADGETAMAAIMAERNRLYAKGGVSIADALQKAVDKIAPALAPEGFVAPARSGTPGKGSTTKAPAVDTRPARAAARGAATEAGQPPALRGGQGNAPTGTVDPEHMTEAQFEALSPAERARLRGD